MEEKSTHHCKNCSTENDGEFCSFCGQCYHAHKESFGELVYEFISDFVHFDSRFFKTILPLLFLPGKLTKSYNEGKQRSQFHPIRLYLFSSFVYFFLFFYFNNVEPKFENGNNNHNPAAFIIDSAANAIRQDSLDLAIKNPPDLSDKKKVLTNLSKANSLSDVKEFVTLDDSNTHLSFTSTSYIDSLLRKNTTPEEYLKQQKTMVGKNRAGYFQRIITIKLLKINLQGEEGKKEFFKKLIETFFHNIPKMLFFLLPVFALLLKLIYIRRKQFYYVDHAVLSLHFFSLVFLLLILSNYILDKIFGTSVFTQLSIIWMILYLLIAMKKLYKQSWRKTVFKFFALGFLFLFAVIIMLLGNMAWSAIMI